MSKTKRALALFIFLSIAVIFSYFASAEILISQVSDRYNVGDKFNVSITLIYSSDTTDLLRVTFQCGEKEIEIYRNTHSVEANEEEKIMVSTVLGDFLIGDVRGECVIKVFYAEEEKIGSTFELTNELEVTMHANAITFSPEEEIIIEGSVKKANSFLEEGFVEARLENTNITNFGIVKDGKFSLKLKLPGNIKGSQYQIFTKAYERSPSGEVTNEGVYYVSITVRQVPKSIDIALDTQRITPDSELSYSIMVLDQAGENINTDASLKIFLPDGKIKMQEIVKTGETQKLFFARNETPGTWKMQASTGSLTAERKFEISELKELSFKLENSILTVTNIGNVPYSGFFEVTIGEKNEVKELKNLPVGESKKFNLKAPEGEYSISVKNNDAIKNLGTIFLTGRAISIDDIGGNIFGDFMIVFWIVLIIIALATVIYFIRKVKRKSYTGREPTSSTSIGANMQISPFKKMQMGSTPVASAISTDLIQKGEKKESAIISLYIKNSSALSSANSEALRVIDGALAKAKEKKAKIYIDGDYRVIVIAPQIINEDIYLFAIKVASEIEKAIVNHNRKSALKIQYSFGITLGYLIVESSEGKFKFMSVDNVIVNAKRISSMTANGIFITEDIHRRTISAVKAEKLPDRNLWKVQSVTDRSEHREFIDKFMNRQNKK